MLYPGHESAQLEFKREIPGSYFSIIKTVIGFCNLYGGKVIIGVADDSKIVGVSEDNISKNIDAIQQAIFSRCSPLISPNIYSQRIDDKLLLIIEVAAGMNKPYFLTSEGVEQGTYIRVGATTYKATSEVIHELRWKSRGHSSDEIPLYAGDVQAIESASFTHFLSSRHKNSIDVTKYSHHHILEFMKSYKLLWEENHRFYPTLAGILLFSQKPQHYLPEAFVICSHFQGTQGRQALATRDCTGTLFQQVNDCMAFLTERLYHSFEITKSRRKEMLEIPEMALREIVINALVHRDYQISAPCKIAIYADRIEIFSPGNFPGPIKTDNLELGITYIRNPVICNIFREAGYIEKLGSGFITLFSEYRKYGLSTPSVIEGNGFVKCVLPRRSENEALLAPVDDKKSLLMNLFTKTESIKSSDVTKYLKISRQTASRLLSTMIEQGAITKKGKGAGTVYFKAQF